jgi:hypothetical protein
MSATRVGLDAGSRLAKVAVDRGAGADTASSVFASRPGLPSGPLAQAIAIGRGGTPTSATTGPGSTIPAGRGDVEPCLAVPDCWLDGSVAGGRNLEALRRAATEDLGLTRVGWAGQLAAVTALAATDRAQSRTSPRPTPPAGPGARRAFAAGRYLACDVGARGVRVACCEATATGIRQLAVHDAPDGGERDFDASIRTAIGGADDPGLAEWYKEALGQDRRARLIFQRAKDDPHYLAARVYALLGADDGYELTAAQAAACFTATADRIRAGVAAVLGGVVPDAVTLSGGLAWFPLAADVLAEAAGMAPTVMGLDAAARGALLLADDQAGLGGRAVPSASLPMHQVRDGLLKDVSVPLPLTTSSGRGDEPVDLAGAELALDVGARRLLVPLPGLAEGRYRAAVSPSWSGTGALVLRADRLAEPAPGWPRPAADANADPIVVAIEPLERLGGVQ